MFRSGFIPMLDSLGKHEIPFTIVSAGMTETIEATIELLIESAQTG
jgi:2-hydroxy-3-keto-5-methylthiopentenyl-1-phosphate phosphatase